MDGAGRACRPGRRALSPMATAATAGRGAAGLRGTGTALRSAPVRRLTVQPAGGCDVRNA